MSKAAEFKTNVMRILEQAKVPFRHHCYLESGAVSGLEVAAALGQDPAHVFKTLVTVEKSGEHTAAYCRILSRYAVGLSHMRSNW